MTILIIVVLLILAGILYFSNKKSNTDVTVQDDTASTTGTMDTAADESAAGAMNGTVASGTEMMQNASGTPVTTN